jgi:hypothetical protein
MADSGCRLCLAGRNDLIADEASLKTKRRTDAGQKDKDIE